MAGEPKKNIVDRTLTDMKLTKHMQKRSDKGSNTHTQKNQTNKHIDEVLIIESTKKADTHLVTDTYMNRCKQKNLQNNNRLQEHVSAEPTNTQDKHAAYGD